MPFHISPEIAAILAAASISIVLYQYIPYVKSVLQGKTHPHIFSWFLWGVLTFIAFFGQISEGAGMGAWVTGFTAAGCLLICVLCYRYGETNIKVSDWLCLVAGLAAIPVWIVTKDPLNAVIIITCIDALAFYPTYRKSWHKPHDELLQTYVLSGTKFVLALLVLENFSPATWLYPASLVLMNYGFVLMVIYRRRVLQG